MQYAGLFRVLAEQSGILRITQIALLLARLHYVFKQSLDRVANEECLLTLFAVCVYCFKVMQYQRQWLIQ